MKTVVIIPARNAEKTLERCLKSVNEALKLVEGKKKTLIVINDCTDNTEEVAKRCINRYKSLNAEILYSKKGKLNAQDAGIKKTPNDAYIVFLDSDAFIEKNAIKILLEELKKHKNLIAVGGFTKAIRYQGKNVWKKFLDEVLNIRSRFPQSEVVKMGLEDALKYHPYVFSDPQFKNTNPCHELYARFYIHGRFFALRGKEYWKLPRNNKIVGDDTFLSDYFHHKYGPGVMRIRYDAIAYYDPIVSVIKHYQTYKRIYFDLVELRREYPEFSKFKKINRRILNWEYIKTLKIKYRFFFIIYFLISQIERFLFKTSIMRDPRVIWK